MESSIVQGFSADGIKVNSREKLAVHGNQNDRGGLVFFRSHCIREFNSLLRLPLPNFCTKALSSRKIFEKRSLSNVVNIAFEISQLKKSLRLILVEMEKSTPEKFLAFKKNLKISFRNVFISHCESEDALVPVNDFVKSFCESNSNPKYFKQVYSQCHRVLRNSGAMALYGVFNSVCREV